MEGATRLPAAVLYSVNNPLHCYGRHWTYRRPGGLSSLLGSANRRRLHFNRFRSFVGDYLPAVVVDGFFMATQYDIPWANPLGGFELYDQVQALEFIKAGLEVGIARQEAVWCLHSGRLQEPSHQQITRRQVGIHNTAAAFRKLFRAFISVPAWRLFEQYREAEGRVHTLTAEFGGEAPSKGTVSGGVRVPDASRESLGVVIVSFDGRGALLRTLRALSLQCEALKEVEHLIVVVDNASTDGTAEVVRREFPHVTVITNDSNEGPARGFNLGLRHLGFPTFVLVMSNDVEFPTGTLARMRGYLREHASIAGVVAAFTNPDGTAQFQRTAIVELMPRRPRQPQPITFVDTTCALVRGEVFFDVGLYDERFSSCHEALDWSLRAKRKGYKFAHLPEARVLQYRSGRLRQEERTGFAERSVANLWLVYKHTGRRWATVLYWVQRVRAKWLVFRWRRDSEARHQFVEAITHMEAFYRRLREENRRPQLIEPQQF